MRFQQDQDMEEHGWQGQLSRRSLPAGPPPVVGDSDDRTGDV